MLYKICKSDQIKDDSLMVFEIDKTSVLVGRRKGQIFACNNSCPHRGASLSKGHFENNNIICYMHGYEYDVFTGNLVNMKSWKKENTWVEQAAEWRKSGNLQLYKIWENNQEVYLEINE